MQLEEAERRLGHSLAAGHVSAAKGIVLKIEQRAGNAFICGDDKVAHVLRGIADEIRRDSLDPKSRELDLFLKADEAILREREEREG